MVGTSTGEIWREEMLFLCFARGKSVMATASRRATIAKGHAKRFNVLA
jgi:hypothetical protein